MNLLSPLGFLAGFLVLLGSMLGIAAVMAWREGREGRAKRKRGQS